MSGWPNAWLLEKKLFAVTERLKLQSRRALSGASSFMSKWLARDRAYRNTVSGAFWTGFEAGAATVGQAALHLTPFVDTYYVDKDVNAAWERAGLKDTWTEAGSRLSIKFSFGVAAIAGGIAATPYLSAAAIEILPEQVIVWGGTVLNHTITQVALTEVFVGVTYAEGRGAIDAANAGNMELFADHANNSIFSAFGVDQDEQHREGFLLEHRHAHGSVSLPIGKLSGQPKYGQSGDGRLRPG